MAVDQQRYAFIVGLLGVTGEMDLADMREAENRRDIRSAEKP